MESYKGESLGAVGHGKPGFKLRLANTMRREQTPAEEALWFHLRAHRFLGLKFRRQQVVRGFICDFYCHELQLVIEVDGPIHVEQSEYDRERDEYLKSFGLEIIRLTNDDVFKKRNEVLGNLEKICRRIAEARS